MGAQQSETKGRESDDTRSMACFPEYFLDNGVVAFRPVPRPLHRPEVKDVPDQKKGVRFGGPEKVEQTLGLTTSRSEMNVRNPDRPVLQGSLLVERSRPMRKAEIDSAARGRAIL